MNDNIKKAYEIFQKANTSKELMEDKWVSLSWLKEQIKKAGKEVPMGELTEYLLTLLEG